MQGSAPVLQRGVSRPRGVRCDRSRTTRRSSGATSCRPCTRTAPRSHRCPAAEFHRSVDAGSYRRATVESTVPPAQLLRPGDDGALTCLASRAELAPVLPCTMVMPPPAAPSIRGPGSWLDDDPRSFGLALGDSGACTVDRGATGSVLCSVASVRRDACRYVQASQHSNQYTSIVYIIRLPARV